MAHEQRRLNAEKSLALASVHRPEAFFKE